jgi:hypothetical protein
MERCRKDLIRITKINKNGDIGIIQISPYTKKYLTKPKKLEYSLNYNFCSLYLRGNFKSSDMIFPQRETFIG